MIRRAALVLLLILIVYAAYLGGRIVVERRTVSARVDAIIAASDPDELTLSGDRRRILLAVEDPTFLTNKGVDFVTPGGGMTTLSQGLGKKIFFERFTPGFPKGELIVLTRFALYPEVDKDRTLTALIATANFGSKSGRPVNGFADGARAWLGKPLSSLSDRDYLSLIAMLPAPSTYNPQRHPAANADRVARIERLLAGRCTSDGFRDVMLNGCAVGS